jgi:hypothetical protein
MSTITPEIKELLDAIHVSQELSTEDEYADAIRLLHFVKAMSSGHHDTIIAAFKHGPLDDGDVPSKSARDDLVLSGLIAKVICKGEWGFNACTYKGASAYKLIQVLRKQAS